MSSIQKKLNTEVTFKTNYEDTNQWSCTLTS